MSLYAHLFIFENNDNRVWTLPRPGDLSSIAVQPANIYVSLRSSLSFKFTHLQVGETKLIYFY